MVGDGCTTLVSAMVIVDIVANFLGCAPQDQSLEDCDRKSDGIDKDDMESLTCNCSCNHPSYAFHFAAQ